MSNASNVKAQDRTLVTADAWGEAWTSDEIAFVREMTEKERDEDIAYALGRTLYALWAIQARIRAGESFDASQARTTPVRPLSTRVYTFIGDDVPLDW
jgi:hypothetical protein